MQIKGDRDGFAGRYTSKCGQYVWTITKHYYGKGIGARWMIDGPMFAKRVYSYADVSTQVKDWSDLGVTKH